MIFRDEPRRGPVTHNDRIDRIAALLERLMNRFRPDRRATVTDLNRAERLRAALAAELEAAREREIQRRLECIGFRMADSGLRINRAGGDSASRSRPRQRRWQ